MFFFSFEFFSGTRRLYHPRPPIKLHHTMNVLARPRPSTSDALALVTPAGPAATGLLELPSLGPDEWLGVGVWNSGGPSKVLDSLAGELGSPEEDGSGSGWGDQGELVESQALSSGLQDPLPGGLGEAQGADAHLRHVVHTHVVGDGSDEHGDLSVLALHELGQLRGDKVKGW